MENTQLSVFYDFLRSKLSSWKDVDNNEIEFHLFSSITNKVYGCKVTRNNINPNTIILRKFCSEEGIIDKEKEHKVFSWVSKIGIAPKCYGQQDDMRLEEYIPSRIILANEYKQKRMRRKIAQVLASIHKIDVPGVDKTPLFENILKNQSFYEYFNKKCDQNIYSSKEREFIEKVKKLSSQQEQDFLKNLLPKDSIVFSHNDLLEGNVLITKDDEDVRFIDYEYAAYNFRGYDIGNMFREAMIDYTVSDAPYFKMVDENYPSDEELRDFLRYYIVFTDMDENEQKEKAFELINNDEAMTSLLQQNYSVENLKRRENELYRETKIGTMLSFYYWLIWAVKMYQVSEAQFDYLEFARVNFEYYEKLKHQIKEF